MQMVSLWWRFCRAKPSRSCSEEGRKEWIKLQCAFESYESQRGMHRRDSAGENVMLESFCEVTEISEVKSLHETYLLQKKEELCFSLSCMILPSFDYIVTSLTLPQRGRTISVPYLCIYPNCSQRCMNNVFHAYVYTHMFMYVYTYSYTCRSHCELIKPTSHRFATESKVLSSTSLLISCTDTFIRTHPFYAYTCFQVRLMNRR